MRDIDSLFAALQQSKFRSGFALNAKDRAYLDQKGMPTIMKHAGEFILKRLAPAMPANDGKQTPTKGHPAFVAQHATAICCRSCLSKWHHILQGKELDSAQVSYLLTIIERWLTLQVTN